MIRDPLIPRLVSTTEAADILGMARSHVHRLVTEGKLPAAHAGSSIVLAEETVRRYKAGERFSLPSQLRVSVYDESADGWTIVRTVPVGPEYVLPTRFPADEYDIEDGVSWRVELVDVTGKTMKVAHPVT
ncbi:helix-turn-helix domain-containing protein [Labedaea rhizosphaerae]|nr:helix-turn-helix domain-containing protein [Labedaea rhizosphaerae]